MLQLALQGEVKWRREAVAGVEGEENWGRTDHDLRVFISYVLVLYVLQYMTLVRTYTV